MITDPIADMFTRIRNANAKLFEKVDVPSSKLKIEIAKILKEEGYIANYKSIDDYKQGILRVYLRYTTTGAKVLKGIKRVSGPGLRVYRKSTELPKVTGGLGIAIISTPRGLMTDRKARKEKLGGEVLGYAW
ncbi:MAG TPA: 30S ribosomal protein S8 [Elusimicrobia bacterium]|nr:MAG: 30S ribosomal protein S8 [Elusimicrobia bacterium RIFOXYA12_FULL_49_49]OGS06138.1 MAG: 30S ribosomal protein S8 [Elusimicrobia bacterium RIFOXYA1_FULL_47_7]OGS09421.1 MAG: 30S ribosomal protein S8 [Elusimicrobia bacterium RIFOXYB1_FULL_48_9]OGS14601.1 MAG: 30S ribosomal protein S8 [Elusimicrobia bacterium RIFOXYA2_FULL_47_53]OGS25746.1 MAG: 30S ribosomal protein S8 [Elusimicrobia bacterium RIFOXYB12_FULL_50_12]OGS31692.1 MAG: 30S ribosomal protein S8 [Elusimicrobia bacterium RIFOXYB2_F